MKQFILVFLGGGLGSVARYWIGKQIGKTSSFSSFPLGTFVVNIVGCFLIGMALGFLAKNTQASKGWSLLLATGFCGGFTTFSSFSYENFLLLQRGETTYAFLYTALSVLIGLGSCALGWWLVR